MRCEISQIWGIEVLFAFPRERYQIEKRETKNKQTHVNTAGEDRIECN